MNGDAPRVQLQARIAEAAARKYASEKPLDVALDRAHADNPIPLDTPQAVMDATSWWLNNRKRRNGEWVCDWRLYGWGSIR